MLEILGPILALSSGIHGAPVMSPMEPVDLDAVRAELHDWSESLWVKRGDRGGFRKKPDTEAHLMTTFDMAWLRYAINDLDSIDAKQRELWIRWIRQNQCWEDGLYRYPPGEVHSDGHALWMAVRALNILGGELALLPKHIDLAMQDAAGLHQWFRVWEKESFNHHDVLGITPVLASTDDAAWVDAFYEEIASQQDPEKGTWPKERWPSISRTYAYCVLHRAVGRMPPQPEKIIDAMLAMQRADGSWGRRYSNMDAVYILVRVAPHVGHRMDDVGKALERNARWLPAMYAEEKQELMLRPHDMVAVAHNFGLLAEVYPETFRATIPWRFDWDDPSFYQCDVISEHLSSRK